MKKLTQEVFSLPECPAEATIAVVNKDGTLCFGTYKKAKKEDARYEGAGWYGLGKGKWFLPGTPGYDGTTYPKGCKLMKTSNSKSMEKKDETD